MKHVPTFYLDVVTVYIVQGLGGIVTFSFRLRCDGEKEKPL